MDGRKLLVALTIVIFLASPSSGESLKPGWDVAFNSPNVFIGEPINITVLGPLLNNTAEIRVINANGTLIRDYYALMQNGKAYYNYTTNLDDPSGTWVVNVYVNGTAVARGQLTIVFDEMNYLSKRINLLEKNDVQQRGLITSLINDNKNLHSQLDLIFWPAILLFVVLSLIGFWLARSIAWPLRCFLVELEKAFGPSQNWNWWHRFIEWLDAPYSSSELEQFHTRKRLQKPPKWPAQAIARRAVQWGKEHDALQTRRPIKKVVANTKTEE